MFDSQNSPLSLNYTSAVTVDSRGQIWIGTRNGLYVYNPTGSVELGPYSFSSPVDSLTIIPDGQFAKASFRPKLPSTIPVTYQLQRGRGTHKFWTVAELQYTTTPPKTVNIVDTSVIIGKYFYRIREVSSNGCIRCSNPIEFIGGTPSVTLVAFDYYFSDKFLFFRWDVKDESYVQRYCIYRSDSPNGQLVLLKSVYPDSSLIVAKRYEVLVDTLRYLSSNIQYSLWVKYADSTQSELKTINVAPLLPSTFWVSPNYPNPFNNYTTFDIAMPVKALVVFRIYDIIGREILSKRQMIEQGYQKIQVDMSSFSSGIYFYSFESIGKRFTGKLVLLK